MIRLDATSQPDALRIGMLAPPWLAVPPHEYGGTELVIDVLSRGLQQLGHEVILFTIGESQCAVPKTWLFETSEPDRMGTTIIELRHVSAGYEALEGCDIVHDHTLAGLFLSQLQAACPVVTTNHGPFTEDLNDLFRRAPSVPIIAISRDQASRAPCDIPVAAVIHHGLDTTRYAYHAVGGDYLVSLGRMNPTKGIHIAIDVARRSGRRLLIAAKMREPGEKQYFDQVIRPELGDDIEFVGEVGHAAKVELLGNAHAVVNPIQWPEPFGLVMTESLACGTPVVATPRGAAPEIVEHGKTGFLGGTVDELVAGVSAVDDLDRSDCRRSVERFFSMERMARDHCEFYRSVVDRSTAVDLRAHESHSEAGLEV